MSASENLVFASIYRETAARLDILSRRVQEGRDVQAASEFCRWLLFSGLITLLKANSNRELPPLKVDGAFIEWKTNDLLQTCNECFVKGQASGNLSAAYLQSLHEKIDLMAGYLGKLSVAPAVVNSGGGPVERHTSGDCLQIVQKPTEPPTPRSGGATRLV